MAAPATYEEEMSALRKAASGKKLTKTEKSKVEAKPQPKAKAKQKSPEEITKKAEVQKQKAVSKPVEKLDDQEISTWMQDAKRRIASGQLTKENAWKENFTVPDEWYPHMADSPAAGRQEYDQVKQVEQQQKQMLDGWVRPEDQAEWAANPEAMQHLQQVRAGIMDGSITKANAYDTQRNFEIPDEWFNKVGQGGGRQENVDFARRADQQYFGGPDKNQAAMMQAQQNDAARQQYQDDRGWFGKMIDSLTGNTPVDNWTQPVAAGPFENPAASQQKQQLPPRQNPTLDPRREYPAIDNSSTGGSQGGQNRRPANTPNNGNNYEMDRMYNNYKGGQ